MFTDVNNVLNFSKELLSSSLSVGICENKCDSSFLFHHFLSFYLKNECNVVFVSLCQSFGHFNCVSSKLGNNLTKLREENKLIFVEGVKSLSQCFTYSKVKGDNQWQSCILANGEFLVTALFNILKKHVETAQNATGSSHKTVLVIDSISTLLDVGVSARDTLTLVQYLRVLMTDIKGHLILGCAENTTDEHALLLSSYLCHSMDLNIQVHGLQTGYCRDVHGQLITRWLQPFSREKTAVRSWQFKLTDKTCAVFAAGMSSAVL
ncbi:elongator complex protein 6-like [Dreissena polymorpha]|uniref:Elongator complex protein 6 n=1 Tax=Dreissena polymorpha TaxID=45954 RepID=A0A9D4RBR7_DREPO|nr:elongator complex protein 6-like [Dreissena polymorpha]XP_052262730.1 elongator complex protein 6-like [Dreissena polymorpha]XP_052262731.1 elongator complex protein 6-like [Dreissena polymorpha]KAH3862576.1 hypothetical protein DPMN_025545 [Dreissena polymorpha]